MSKMRRYYFSIIILCCLMIVLKTGTSRTGTRASQANNGSFELIEIGQIGTGGSAYDVWVDDNKEIAYVTCGYLGLRIFNISNPSNPVLLSHVPELTAVINTGHSSAYAHQLLVNNGIVYIGDGPGGLTIINCSDPTNPNVLTRYTGGYSWDIQIIDDVAFVANGWNNLGNPGLSILNITDPSSPVSLYNYSTDFDITDLEVVGNLACLASGSGITLLDISNNLAPVLVGQYTGPPDKYAVDVEISNDHAFLSFWKYGLQILDISDPANINVVGEFTSSGEHDFLYLDADLVYLCAQSDGVIVFNVSDPSLPAEVCRYNADGGEAYGVFVRDDFVFVADESLGLVILKLVSVSNNQTTSSESSISSSSTPSLGFFTAFIVLVAIHLIKRSLRGLNIRKYA